MQNYINPFVYLMSKQSEQVDTLSFYFFLLRNLNNWQPPKMVDGREKFFLKKKLLLALLHFTPVLQMAP